MFRSKLLGIILIAAGLLILSTPALGGRLRYHYEPADACGRMTLKPEENCGGPAERVSWFGAVRQPDYRARRPTHYLTFRQPYTGRPVSVPVTLPEGTPRIEYRAERVIYNYGSYTVEIHFLADGSADVIYNSGLFRQP